MKIQNREWQGVGKPLLIDFNKYLTNPIETNGGELVDNLKNSKKTMVKEVCFLESFPNFPIDSNP